MEQKELVRLIKESFNIHELAAVLNNGISLQRNNPGLPLIKLCRYETDLTLNTIVVMYSYGGPVFVDYVEGFHFNL